MDYTREQLGVMTEEELDEIVHDLKSEEAAEINNRGKDAQIEYILGLLEGGRPGLTRRPKSFKEAT
jgi:hypothetical protein